MRIVYRFDPLELAGANLGIDPAASGERFREALQLALEQEWPEASVEVTPDTPVGCTLEGFDDSETIDLRVEGLARGVRKAGQWIVYR